MTDMYAENILDHWNNPRNFGEIPDAEIKSKAANPLCGDIVEIFIKTNGNSVEEIKFKGDGCAISKASASMLTEEVKNKNFEEIKKMEFRNVEKLLKIEISPMRIKCAILPLVAIKNGIENLINKR